MVVDIGGSSIGMVRTSSPHAHTDRLRRFAQGDIKSFRYTSMIDAWTFDPDEFLEREVVMNAARGVQIQVVSRVVETLGPTALSGESGSAWRCDPPPASGSREKSMLAMRVVGWPGAAPPPEPR